MFTIIFFIVYVLFSIDRKSTLSFYYSENSAQEAFMNLNGRFYGGKQISCQFVEIKKWKSAICGQFYI